MPSVPELRQEVLRRRRLRVAKPARIALDVMGTDHSPEEIVLGAWNAIQQFPGVTVICVGKEPEIQRILRRNGWHHKRLLTAHASEVVGMEESPKDTLRKKDSSVAVAARLVKEGHADALVSPGNTGATMATCLFSWRTLPNIQRPAIAAFIPHPETPCIFLDAGANVDCKPRQLLHFAIMGHVYARYVFHRRKPRIGLLNIGEEENKGNDLTYETMKLLKQSNMNFLGNAEGRDLFKNRFDVIVCDGFVGNVLLKFAEGLVGFVFETLKKQVGDSFMNQMRALPMVPIFREFKKQIDHEEYGGAPLLGLNGTCIICHGSAKSRAITNAIRTASQLVGHKVKEHIADLAAEHAHLQ